MRAASESLSILVADDDVVDRMAVRRALRATALDAQLAEVDDAPEALAALRTDRFDCLILDFHLPRGDALSVLHTIAAERLHTAVIVLTGQGDEQLAVEIMKAGASDYISKAGVTPERLTRSIVQSVRLRRAELVAEAQRARVARLQQLTEAMAAKRSVTEVADVAVTRAREAYGAARALFAILASDDQTVRIVQAAGYDEHILAPWRSSARSIPSPLSDAIGDGQPLLLKDAEAVAARYPSFEVHAHHGDHALVALPLIADARVLGVVLLAYADARSIDDDQWRELSAFARACAQSLDRAQIFDFAQAERRRAEEASRSKDEFLAVVSHELRTPLSAILGWAKMMSGGTLGEDQMKRAVEVIERNAVSQAQLIEDLLDVSRITTGKLKIESSTIDVTDIVHNAIDVVRNAADSKGISLEVELDGESAPLQGDETRLQQVFWNLLSNAVKFTPREGRVLVRLVAEPSGYIVSVADTGQGIDPVFLPHVFERFRQEEGSVSRSTRGLGLGLSIARHIVELHGGTIDAQSAGMGAGTTMTVRLPFHRPARISSLPVVATSAADQRPRMKPPAAPRRTLEGLRVLVVDDETDVRELLLTVLVEAKAEVVTASSASEAYELLRRMKPDVLVSDIAMPVEDGYQLIERVRALPAEEGGATPAIALTAFARGEDRSRALLAGFDKHATKPIEPNELTRVIAEVCRTD